MGGLFFRHGPTAVPALASKHVPAFSATLPPLVVKLVATRLSPSPPQQDPHTDRPALLPYLALLNRHPSVTRHTKSNAPSPPPATLSHDPLAAPQTAPLARAGLSERGPAEPPLGNFLAGSTV